MDHAFANVSAATPKRAKAAASVMSEAPRVNMTGSRGPRIEAARPKMMNTPAIAPSAARMAGTGRAASGTNAAVMMMSDAAAINMAPAPRIDPCMTPMAIAKMVKTAAIARTPCFRVSKSILPRARMGGTIMLRAAATRTSPTAEITMVAGIRPIVTPMRARLTATAPIPLARTSMSMLPKAKTASARTFSAPARTTMAKEFGTIETGIMPIVTPMIPMATAIPVSPW
jgi:hypothetical protein